VTTDGNGEGFADGSGNVPDTSGTGVSIGRVEIKGDGDTDGVGVGIGEGAIGRFSSGSPPNSGVAIDGVDTVEGVTDGVSIDEGGGGCGDGAVGD
jgi:hypothetical protein